MKKLIGSLSMLLLTTGAIGQEKQTVHSIIVECHEIEWYKTQELLWKKEVELNKSNGEAWINYYGSVRALRNLTSSDKKTNDGYRELGNKIVADAYAFIPESFEANYMMYWNGQLGQNDEKYLQKAYSLQPEDPRVLLDLLINTEIKRDKEQFSSIAKKLFQLNRMPSGALNWAYNSLTEVSPNGILLTAGDNDTYAVWIVQEALNYRKDVMVMNTSMLLIPEYRAKLFKEKGLSPIANDNPETSEQQLFNHLFLNKTGIPVHVSGSAIGIFNDTIYSNKLYLTGLTYVYSTENIENIAVIKRNFEKRFLLDHLTKSFSYSTVDLDSRIKQMYLPGLIKLYQHHKTAEDVEQSNYYKGLIDIIAKELNMQEEVQKALGN